MLWTKQFLEDQGVGIKNTIIYQDNMSSILLKKWKAIKYKKNKTYGHLVFLHDQHVQNKTLSIEHCPTNDMLADFFSKPLQGGLFMKLFNFIKGAEYD